MLCFYEWIQKKKEDKQFFYYLFFLLRLNSSLDFATQNFLS